MNGLPSFELVVMLQVTGMTGVALLLILALRRRSAHAATIASLTSILILLAPVLVLFVPSVNWFNASFVRVEEPVSEGEREVFVSRHREQIQPSFLPKELPLQELKDNVAADVPAVLEQPDITFSEASPPGVPPAAMIATNPPPSAVWTWSSMIWNGIGLIWIAGGLLALIRFLYRRSQLKLLRRSLRPVSGLLNETEASSLASVLKLKTLPPLLTSEIVPIPLVLGSWKPVIVLPQSLLETANRNSLRQMILHEAAHIARFDHWSLLLQQANTTLYWWHPGVRLLHRVLVRSREEVCDNFVLQQSNPADYAEMLFELAPRRAAVPLTLPLLGLLTTSWSLEQRIAGLVDPHRRLETHSGRPFRFFLLTGFLLLAVLVGGVQRSRAVANEQGNASTQDSDQSKVESPSPVPDQVRKNSPTGRLLQKLKQQNANRNIVYSAEWLRTLKAIADLGPESVPELVQELKSTEDPTMISCLAFLMRGIGDARAIPALIQSVPKIPVQTSQDMGLVIDEEIPDRARLMNFVQNHATSGLEKGNRFHFGRPFHEIYGALHRLSGQRFNEAEFVFTNIAINPSQPQLTTQLFLENANQWKEWWIANFQSFGVSRTDAVVDLPAYPVFTAGATPGKHFTIRNGINNTTIGPATDPRSSVVFLDLDTNRRSRVPEQFLPTVDSDPSKNSDLERWAIEQGFDLMGSEIASSEKGTRFYTVQPLQLKIWKASAETVEQIKRLQIITDRWSETLPLLGPLIFENSKATDLDALWYVFQTEHGTCGLLKLNEEQRHDRMPTAKFDLWTSEGRLAYRHQVGREFELKFLTPAGAPGNRVTPALRPDPFSPDGIPPGDALPTIPFPSGPFSPLTPTEFEEKEIRVSGVVKRKDGQPLNVNGYSGKGWISVTRDGATGIKALVNPDGKFSTRVKYQRVSNLSLASQQVVLQAEWPNAAITTVGPFILQGGQDLTDLVIELETGSRAAIQFQGPSGELVDGGKFLARPNNQISERRPVFNIGETGKGVVPYIGESLCYIEVAVSGYEHRKFHNVVLHPNQTTTLHLSPTKPQRGIITDLDGKPVPGAKVFLAGSLDSQGQWVRSSLGSVLTMIQSDQKGQFQLESLPTQGSQFVSVIASAFGSELLEVSPGGPDLHLQLGPTRILRGRIYGQGISIESDPTDNEATSSTFSHDRSPLKFRLLPIPNNAPELRSLPPELWNREPVRLKKISDDEFEFEIRGIGAGEVTLSIGETSLTIPPFQGVKDDVVIKLSPSETPSRSNKSTPLDEKS